MNEGSAEVVAFRRKGVSTPAHPRTLMEAVYTAGSLAVEPDDQATKMAAALMQTLGLLTVAIVAPDGSTYPLRPGELKAAMDRPWRVMKPAFAGEAGVPDSVIVP